MRGRLTSMHQPFLTTRKGVLFAEDCMALLKDMRSGCVDSVFADPPFNLGKDYKNGYHDKMSQFEYLRWCEEWITECCRILKPGGAIFIYATPELAVKFGNILYELATFRHWIALSMKGTYSRGKKLYPAHYALLYYTRGQPRTFNHVRVPIPTCRHCGREIKDYGGHRDKLNPLGLNLTDFWDDTSPNRHRKFKVRLGVNELKLMIPERAILISTNENDVVFDPFGGGGSTYQAAELNGRFWIGTELHDSEHILRRLNEKIPFSLRKKPEFEVKRLFKHHEDYQDAFLQRRSGKGLSARAR